MVSFKLVASLEQKARRGSREGTNKKEKRKGFLYGFGLYFLFLLFPFLQSDKGCNMLMLNAIVSIILEEFVSLILFFLLLLFCNFFLFLLINILIIVEYC